MALDQRLTDLATGRPRLVTGVIVALVLVLVVLAALPSLWPTRFPFLNPVAVDTDPENMLSPSEPVRVFHDEMKEKLSLYDMIIVGVVNDHEPEGVFNPASLARIHELTEYAKTLQGAAIGEDDPRAGVIESDLMAPSTVDAMEPGGLGVVNFSWLMQTPPATPAPVATNLDDPVAYAAEVVVATNDARATEGLAELEVADCAAQAAAERARALVGVAELTHAPLDGAMRDCGVEQAAENLSRASAPAQDVVEAWLGSPGHRNNLLDPTLDEIGVACVPDDAALLCSQVFLGR